MRLTTHDGLSTYNLTIYVVDDDGYSRTVV